MERNADLLIRSTGWQRSWNAAQYGLCRAIRAMCNDTDGKEVDLTTYMGRRHVTKGESHHLREWYLHNLPDLELITQFILINQDAIIGWA
jgi:hypothetical protein